MCPSDSAEPSIPKGLPSIGEGYTLTGKLGEGAFGEVFKARHELLGQEFAVKILKPELCEDQDVRDRFLDEARALIQFSHPNIVQVRHVGEHAGRLFLVMDLVDGTELSAIMERDGAFDEQRALDLMQQILSGLDAAHAAGIVHRDLKPSNILIQDRGDGRERISILDFGLSKFSAVDGVKGAHRSITGTIVGTLAYMSPEQIKGERDIDGRSDLFAAGLIFLEMLQGHHPYPGESGIVVAAKLLRDPIPPIKDERASEISPTTRSALARALERDRDARFGSVIAFAQALEGKGPPSDTSRVTTIEDAQAELARQEAAKRTRAERARGAKKRSLVPLVVVLLLLGGGAAAFFGLGLGKSSGNGDGDGGARTADGGTGGGAPAPVTPDPDPDPVKPEPEPVKPDPEPVKPEPEPVKPDPEPVKPDPEPVKPDPEPVKPDPEPVKPDPEPVKPDPEPAKPDPEPVKPDPEPAVPAPEPQPETPFPTPVEGPAATADLPPVECCTKAAALVASGEWKAARDLFKQAMAKSELTDPVQVTALRGTAASYISEADLLARSGKIAQAQATLTEAMTWLQERYAAYQKLPQAHNVVPLQLGFARMHLAEAITERARWLALGGDKEQAGQALADAAIHYDFALHQLERDGVRYWEFLIRRARMHRLQGDSQKMVDDVAYTTKTNNVEVPAHMWVAHATAVRRVAEAWAARGSTAEALQWAQKAVSVAEDGASWQEDKLSRQQWLDMARVLFVAATLQPPSTDATALHGKLRYWVGEAAKREPAAWLHADVAQARLLTAQAMERVLKGLALRHGKSDRQATRAFEAASKLAAQAIALREAVQAAGGLAADSLPYVVQAGALTALGKSAEAQKAAEAARNANLVNPD